MRPWFGNSLYPFMHHCIYLLDLSQEPTELSRPWCYLVANIWNNNINCLLSVRTVLPYPPFFHPRWSPLSHLPPPSLSLSYTHVCTHTHIHTQLPYSSPLPQSSKFCTFPLNKIFLPASFHVICEPKRFWSYYNGTEHVKKEICSFWYEICPSKGLVWPLSAPVQERN